MSRFLLLCLTCVMVMRGSVSRAEPASIFILRHAEKINDKDVHLSPRGELRAQALAAFFTLNGFNERFGPPAGLYAVHANEGQSLRSIETLTPTAQALRLGIDTDFSRGDEEALMKNVLTNPAYDAKTVIIAWSHNDIPKLLKPFKNDLDVPSKWPKGVFDRFWLLTKDTTGAWVFSDIPQKLLPGDSEE